MKTFYLLLLCLVIAAAQAEVVFEQDFSAGTQVDDFRGEGDHLFDFIDRAGEAIEPSIQENAFHMVVAYDKSHSEIQNSALRLTRLSPLSLHKNFAVVQCKVTLAPSEWPGTRTNYFQFAIGENFRATPFNPARENQKGEGPAFVALSIATAPSLGEFLVYVGRNQTSVVFSAEENDGGYVLPLTMAFNGGAESQTFSSPSGDATVNAGSFSVWVGDELIWENAPASHTGHVNLENFSFGFGRGIDSTASEAVSAEGTFSLTNIVISTPAP